jgi:hypothetical protein
MADFVNLIEGEVVDCGTISITYQTNGLAQISFTVYRPKEEGVPYAPGGPGFSMCAGGVDFEGWVTEQSLVPASEIEWNEWKITAIAVGCRREDACVDPC